MPSLPFYLVAANWLPALEQDAESAEGLAVAALAISALAVVVGPVIQLRIAKLAFRSSVLSANRQAWIDRLRVNFALFHAEADRLWMKLYYRFRHDGGIGAEPLMDYLREISRIESEIVLMLNPREADHEALVAGMRRVRELLKVEEVTKGNGEFSSALDSVREMVRPVLKREWERVKRGE